MCFTDGNIQYTVIPMKKASIKKRFLDGPYEFRFLTRNISDNDI